MTSGPPDVADIVHHGLSDAAVRERVAQSATNDVPVVRTRSIAQIVRANAFTRLNAILGGLLVVILVVGDLRDALFGLVLVANSGIGIIQELRAKPTLDRLVVVTAPVVRVVRAGVVREVRTPDVVLDDVLELRPGDQLVVDGTVLSSDGLEIDETLLTGESDAVAKDVGGVVAMVPEGLVRLTSTAFAVTVVRLARRRTLVQELPAVEGLARADVLCLDKTGTFAQGPIASTAHEIPAEADDVESAIGAVAALPSMVRRVLRFAVPAGFVAAAATFAGYRVTRLLPDVNRIEAQTTATLVLLSVGLLVLARLAQPLNTARRLLIAATAAAMVLAVAVPGLRALFALDPPPPIVVQAAIGIVAISERLLRLDGIVHMLRRPPSAGGAHPPAPAGAEGIAP